MNTMGTQNQTRSVEVRCSSYGQRGGEGPTRGKKRTNYVVTLPDGSTATESVFTAPAQPTGYAYELHGVWYVATVNEPNAPHLSHYTQCPAVRA